MARLGFASGAALVAESAGLATNPVGWVILGVSVGISLAKIIRWGPPRGEYQKFDREMFPTLKSLSAHTGLDTVTGWFNELVGVDSEGNRKVFGSWIGEGPSWGDKAAARLMDLGKETFLWSYQSGRSEPWVLIGPHESLGSVVFRTFADIMAATGWWDSERERMMRDWEESQKPPETIEPTQEPIDPGEVAPPPGTDPAASIDPPAPPPTVPPPKKPWYYSLIGIGAGILTGILGGNRSGYPGSYPGGYYNGAGALGISGNDWMLLGAAGLLVLASQKKKRGAKHA